MLSAMSPTTMARSSLEEMLDSLRRRDENEKPKDLPPALPARPTSRARLPSARRSLPNNFKVGDELPDKNELQRKWGNNISGEKESTIRGNSFASKKATAEKFGEPPHLVEGCNGLDHAALVLNSARKVREPDREDKVGYFIKEKLNVWCQLANGQWVSGKIQSASGEKALVLLSDGRVVKVSTSEVLPANPDIIETADDLVQLSYLNEPSVLHNLWCRYFRDLIYCKAGTALIAVNPFKDVEVYDHDIVTAYRHKLVDSPHVYATADKAYNDMMKDNEDQSILISGESGAGKTETAKIAMNYLAALGSNSGGTQYKILQTSCILEAFGNAKTLKNDNSSRYEKLIELEFCDLGTICGAKIRTFLLEKSRVTHLASGERSYHIFYQLCAGAPSILRGRLNLGLAKEYSYLNQSGCFAVNDVDDVQKLHMLTEALDALEFSKEDQERAFGVVAAVLWMGNISFQAIDSENYVEVVADEALTTAARLMGCNAQDLIYVISTCKIQVGEDSIAERLTFQQALDARDALAKYMYASLFDWLVDRINMSLEVRKRCIGRSISILDICGFESFQKNSFEQFCINYGNERLQKLFDRHLFKLRQEEYELEGIHWAKVDHQDNQNCLDLFEKKPLGLLSLLDEESNFAKSTDLEFANKAKQHFNANPCFKGEGGGTFSVCHYAGEVLYDASGFLDKNRDIVQPSFVKLLSSCTSLLPQLLAPNMLKQAQPTASPLFQINVKHSQRKTVVTKFKGQLFSLMHQLEKTKPHFIYCIKPNSKKLPGVFEMDLILQQLKCCGVLDVVRLSRSVYSAHMTHQDFAKRYGCLLSEDDVFHDPLCISAAVLKQFNIRHDMYEVGYTNLYFRTGQIDALEDVRQKILQGVAGIQKRMLGHRAQHDFSMIKEGVTTLQSFIRGENVRRKYSILARKFNVSAHKTYDEQQRVIIHLQSVIRGWLARKQLFSMRYNFQIADSKWNPSKKISQLKDLPKEHPQSPLAELQRRVQTAEEALVQKKEESDALREQLEQYERRWSEYETKMKSMEETWQRQMASLQTSLAAAKKSLAPDNTDDYENATSTGARTGRSTSHKFSNSHSGNRLGREVNGNLPSVSHLAKEFEQQRQAFDDDAKALGASPDELRKLKVRFESWKKDYKVRLREAKARIHKLGHSEAEKSRRTWWGKKIVIAS